MPGTLVISDLHLGSRGHVDRLSESAPRAALVDALAAVERLILLGDVLELRQAPIRAALDAAAPVLADVGTALGPAGEVVVVPGNHDHGLLAPWLGRRSLSGSCPALGLESPVDWRDGEPLAEIAQLLAPARVRASYPGVWLSEGVYAMHGHYGDRHTTVPMFERIGAGAMARIVGEPDGGVACAEDYESILAPMYAWVLGLAQAEGRRRGAGPSSRAWRALNGNGRERRLRRLALKAGVPLVIGALDRIGLGPFHRDLSGPELRRASLRAVAESVSRLGIDARHVIFGHTHRAGPLPGDAPEEWRTARGIRLMNTGSWVHEAAFLGPDPASSPYRPGFAVRLAGGGAPELVNLLDPAPPARG